MSFKYLFGPVPSRRLGTSLGIDLTPDKSCTLNCLYCECGKTDELTIERKEYVPTAAVIAELRDYLAVSPELDYITFSGSGEPTLHIGIGKIIDMLKDEYPSYRVSVLTNSTLLHDAQVRADLMRADLVVPSLDAVSEQAFRKINRPKSEIRNRDLIEGLTIFTHEFSGDIWLEVFLIPGLNDSDEEIELFKQTFSQLRATRIQLNSLDRPGAVEGLQTMPRENLAALAARFGSNVEVIGKPILRHRCSAYNSNVEAHILSLLRVRPCTLDDLSDSLRLQPLVVGKYLDVLLSENRLRTQIEERGVFYLAS